MFSLFLFFSPLLLYITTVQVCILINPVRFYVYVFKSGLASDEGRFALYFRSERFYFIFVVV